MIRGFHRLGFRIIATKGTANYLRQQGIWAEPIQKISDDKSNAIPQLLKSKAIDLVINTPSSAKTAGQDGPIIRQTALQFGVPCLTSLDTARALLYALRNQQHQSEIRFKNMEE